MKAMKKYIFALFISLWGMQYTIAQTVQDCPCAIPICQTTYNELNAYSGQGTLPNEINKTISCLGQGEKNDVWYIFTVQSSGLLNFSITPNVITDDYDWAVYNLSSANCSDIFSNPSLEVRCNFAGTPGVTGPNGLPGAQNEPPLPVLIGETYVINVSQFTVSPNGYTISFGLSTASILDITPPAIDSVNTNFVCGQDSFQVTFTENIQCSSVQIADFVLTDPQGNPMTITSVTSPNCGSVCGYARTFIFKFTPGANFLGAYTLDIISNIDDVCSNSCLIPTSIIFNIGSYVYNNVVTNVTCPGGADGAINVSVTSPPGPYTYLWSNGNTTANPTGLSAGTYTVTVSKGGGCPDIKTFVITAPTAWAYVTASTTSACGATTGSASVTVNAGGTGPYTYLWSSAATTSNATGLGAGTYTVTVKDANNCTVTATVAVNQTAGVVASIPANVNVNCFGASTGTATGSGANGSGGYTYLWSNAQTNATAVGLAAGTYTVTVTDNVGGCTSTATVVITQPATAVTAVTNTQTTTCGLNNGLAYVTGGGGTGPYTYLWSNANSNDTISPVASGTYTITVTDSKGCTKTATAVVGASSSVTASIPNSVNVSCNGGTNGTATAGCANCTGAMTYLWSNAQTIQTATGLASGTYTVTVTDANNCTSTVSVNITQPTVLSIINALNDTICLSQFSSITPAGSGGTGPYGYSWSNGNTNALLSVSPAVTTSYTVTVTDNKGCTKTQSVTVYVSPALTVTTSNDTTICSGSAVNVSCLAGGGNTTYTYNWNGGLNITSGFIVNPTKDTTLIIKLTDNCGTPAVYDTVHIYVITPMVLNFPTVVNVSCNGGSNGSATVAIVGGVPVFVYAWSNGQTNATSTGLASGTYTVTITDGNTCSMSSSVVITQPTALAITGMPNATICLSQNATITPVVNGGTPTYTYIWSSAQTTSTITVSPTTATTYTVTVTDSKGCTKTQSVTITVNPALTVTAPKDTIICSGAGVTVTASPGGGNGAFIYSWNGGLNSTNSFTINPTADTTLIIKLTDNCGSPAVYDTMHITVVTPMILTFPIVVNVSCNGGNNGSAQVSINGGIPAYAYLWSNGQTTNTATGLAAGNYTVTLTDGNNCTMSATVNITQPTALTITGMANVTICLSQNTTITPVYGGGTPAFSYSWSSGSTAASITVTPNSTTSYTVTVTDAKGCTLTQSVTVTVNPALSIVASNDTTVCTGDNVVIVANAGGGNGVYNYIWNNGAGNGTPLNFIPAGDTTLVVQLTDNCGSPAVYDTVNIVVVPQLVLNMINIKNVSCFGGNDGAATVSVAGGASPFGYLWSDGNTNATNNQLSAITYTITVTDSKGCSATITVSITEPPQLTTLAIPNDTICIGESSTFAVVPSGGTLPYKYVWSTGGTNAGLTVSPVTTTSYTVTVTDAKNCSTTAVATVIVRPPLTITSISPDATICKGKPITLSITVAGGNAIYSYSYNNGPFIASSSITFTVNSDTVIVITAKDGCTTPRVTDSIIVKAIEAPRVAFTWTPDSGCQPLTVAFFDSTKTVNGSTWLWQFGDGNSSTLLNPVHVYKDYGVFDVTLTVTTPQGCETRLIKPAIIEVFEKPVAYFDFSPKKPTLYYSTVQFYDESSGNPNQWVWTFGDNGLGSFLQNPSHEYADTGKYIVSLIVTNEHGCTDSIYYIVEVMDEFAFYIPSAFTPNGDGKNDQFAIMGINYKNFVQKIFTRWGQPVFESVNRNFWDGTDWNGNKAPAGNYVYQIEVFENTGKKHVFNGNVNLIR